MAWDLRQSLAHQMETLLPAQNCAETKLKYELLMKGIDVCYVILCLKDNVRQINLKIVLEFLTQFFFIYLKF